MVGLGAAAAPVRAPSARAREQKLHVPARDARCELKAHVPLERRLGDAARGRAHARYPNQKKVNARVDAARTASKSLRSPISPSKCSTSRRNPRSPAAAARRQTRGAFACLTHENRHSERSRTRTCSQRAALAVNWWWCHEGGRRQMSTLWSPQPSSVPCPRDPPLADPRTRDDQPRRPVRLAATRHRLAELYFVHQRLNAFPFPVCVDQRVAGQPHWSSGLASLLKTLLHMGKGA